MGRFADAMKDYAATLRADPDYWQARAHRGTLLAQQDRFAAAVREYTLGIRSAPAGPIHLSRELLRLPHGLSGGRWVSTERKEPSREIRTALRRLGRRLRRR
ncbi:MAG TPA: hypothetical protein VKU80_17005 [Planctomycetota bacterium]|nr:hypothetical protein [Planctomycetota bacterium]